MFNPLIGILASSGAVAGGSYESIATSIVGSGGTSTITFDLSSVSGYKHLQLRGIMRTTRSAGPDLLSIRFNSDTGSNYSDHILLGDGSSASTDKDTSATFINIHRSASDVNGSNIFGVYVIDILDYVSTSKAKTVRSLGGYDANGSGQVALNSGAWYNSSTAINRIDLLLPNYSTSFKEYTSFALYGIKD